MKELDRLKAYWNSHNEALVNRQGMSHLPNNEKAAVHRKQQQLLARQAQLLTVTSKVQYFGRHTVDQSDTIRYGIHHQFLIKQQDYFYMEELIQERHARFNKYGEFIEDKQDIKKDIETDGQPKSVATGNVEKVENNQRYTYNRLAAVQYAEQWWNSYNPAYRQFDVDCTNYVSQCLHAGGAPMRGYPNRSKGWWYQNNNWSYSWSVAHALRWYLGGSEMESQVEEVAEASELQQGDIICYDFDGDGRWQHTTIVVAKDDNNMPLVNAHTTNSRMRYWAYEDSTAWTENIQYKFFHIK